MKKYLGIIILALLIIQCKKEDNYTIAKGQLGKITDKTQVKDFKNIFANDSLVASLGEDDFADTPYDEYRVYSKKGKHLLTLMPKKESDSSATIESIQVYDSRYKTIKGLNLNSTCKDIIENYTVNKVESMFSSSSILLFIDELNVTIAMDKKDIGVDQFSNKKVRIDQIPDNAKIKYLTIWFD